MVSLRIKEHSLVVTTVLAIDKTEVRSAVSPNGTDCKFAAYGLRVRSLRTICFSAGNSWGACFTDDESRILNHLATQFIEGSRAKMQ